MLYLVALMIDMVFIGGFVTLDFIEYTVKKHITMSPIGAITRIFIILLAVYNFIMVYGLITAASK